MPFKIQKATLQNVQEIAELLLSVSTSPRLLLEFGSCKREEWSEWYMKIVRCEVKVCEKVGEEGAEALVVVDDEEGRIVGFAVWSWNLTVSVLSVHRFERS
jgi:hypothetical protein